MTALHFEIRVCKNCGLRYPLERGHSFGIRCPHCLGETRVILEHESPEELPREAESPRAEYIALLDNIRSAWNVGSIFRSADGFGFGQICLCGITPTPESKSVRKTALGAEKYIEWSYHQDAVKLVKRMKKQGWKIFALEEDSRAESIARIHPPARTMLILGSEICGVDPELLDLADKILYIPMRGQKRSFNVANAFSVAAYALTTK